MKIVAAISRRFEPDWLIEEFEENMSWCDEILIYDDRGRDPDDLEWNEHLRYTTLHKWAGEAGATFVIMTAPDERWAKDAEQVLRQSIKKYGRKYFRIPVYELYTPTAYRTDGLWGNLPQCRVYPWAPDQKFMDRPLHNLCTPIHHPREEVFIPMAHYHLKHIEHQNIINRIKSFEVIDEDGEYSLFGKGYRYLADIEGIELTEIPEEKMYHPIYSQKYIFNPFKGNKND